jgi:phage replication-related protein YjqB (UPF0714/DUF867 family)
MQDKYSSFTDLARSEVRGEDYDVIVRDQEGARAVIIAPHGGTIEPRTEKIAQAIAGDEFSLYCFMALKKGSGLHVKSHLFDDEEAINLIARHDRVVSIHGWGADGERVCIGGLDKSLIAALKKALAVKGIEIEPAPAGLGALDPHNITNRGGSGAGAQFELTMGFRKNAGAVRRFIDGVRDALLPASAQGRGRPISKAARRKRKLRR